MKVSPRRMLHNAMKMLIPLATLLTCTVIATGSSPPSDSSTDNSAFGLSLNGQPVRYQTSPRLVNSTLMVPLNDLSESLGVQVQWDSSSPAATATATKSGYAVKLEPGNKEALRQNESVTLDAAPMLEQGELLVPLRFFSESFDFHVYWDAASQTASIWDADQSLPTVGSFERMRQLLEQSVPYGVNFDGSISVTAMAGEGLVAVQPTAKQKAAASVPSSGAAESKPAYSTTNVQVEGVDEADIIKTDGDFIYQVNRNRVIVTKAAPTDQMKVVSTVTFDDPHFHARELYIDEKRMVVIGTTLYRTDSKPEPQQAGPDTATSSAAVPSAEPSVVKEKMIVRLPAGRTTTKAVIYELGDRSTMAKVREVELDGQYTSSRKIGDSLYLISNRGISIAPVLRDSLSLPEKEAAIAGSLPSYRDSAVSGSYVSIGYEDIRYFPNSQAPNYLMVAGLSIGDPAQPMNVTSYLGSGNQVYASLEHLYVASQQFEPVSREKLPSDRTRAVIQPGESSTVIYKFAMDSGKVTYSGRGKVPGRVLNQFAMDEHQGYFRIATTKGNIGRTDEHTSKNNMYVLDAAMQTVGKIEDIAPGEQIYSVRYAGNRAYMVTFRTVDPLFVIDLTAPQAPALLGKLKIPGYSNYLHPYDDNHLIGFGKDTVEVSSGVNGNSSGETVGLYQGMKMALFDVTDVANPKELFQETIGDRGTDSELLRNHKALLFSKEDGLLAFPVKVMEIKDRKANGSSFNEASRYGEFTFQGAYVYKLDLNSGFRLQGRITHLTADDYSKAGYYSGIYEKNIERILYIGSTLYTASQQMIKATDKATLTELGSVQLP